MRGQGPPDLSALRGQGVGHPPGHGFLAVKLRSPLPMLIQIGFRGVECHGETVRRGGYLGFSPALDSGHGGHVVVVGGGGGAACFAVEEAELGADRAVERREEREAVDAVVVAAAIR